MRGALQGLKVLELGEFISVPFCTKLLADFGAEVVKIERPGTGDEARRRGPFLNDIPHPERSALFHYLNTNKMSITLDVDREAGRRLFKELIKTVDVLVEDRPPQQLEQWQLAYEDLRELNRNLIMVAITPFGQTGPHRDYKAYYLNVHHACGEAYLLPGGAEWLLDLKRPPVKMATYGGEYECGLNSAIATLAAVYARKVINSGQFIDISKQESLLQMVSVELVKFPNENFVETRATRAYSVGGVTPCKDGFVEIMPLEEHMWQGLVEVMGNPEWARDDRFSSRDSRAEHGEELNALILEWTMQHTKEEIYHALQAKGVPAAPVRTAADFVNSQQIQQRGFIAESHHAEAGTVSIPSSPLKFSETPWQLRRTAPCLGEHNEYVYCQWLGHSKEELAWMRVHSII